MESTPVTINLRTPGADELVAAVTALRNWQYDAAPMQLHPGDLGWFWRFGSEATGAAVRTWSRDGKFLAVGLLDGSDLLRMTIAPEAFGDEELAARLVADLAGPASGVLPAGTVFVEVPTGALVYELLSGAAGWSTGEPWTPLRRDLGEAVEDPGLRIEVTGPDHAAARVGVQRAAFEKSTFTVERWQAMAAGVAYADARCLVGYDERGTAVAAVTVWSAGVGRPGLLEPMGVHRDHRGHGYGRAITVAAAAALQEMGSSSAIVCTRSANVGAVATYRSAGFRPDPEIRDRRRDA
jgi:ribosomal protein S18 acetylase RimI-like enzyme